MKGSTWMVYVRLGAQGPIVEIAFWVVQKELDFHSLLGYLFFHYTFRRCYPAYILVCIPLACFQYICFFTYKRKRKIQKDEVELVFYKNSLLWNEIFFQVVWKVASQRWMQRILLIKLTRVCLGGNVGILSMIMSKKKGTVIYKDWS